MEKHWFQQFIMAKQDSKLKFLEYALYSTLIIGLLIIIFGEFYLNELSQSQLTNESIFQKNIRRVIALVLNVFFGITFLHIDKYLNNRIGNITTLKRDWTYPALSIAFLIWTISTDLTLLKEYFIPVNGFKPLEIYYDFLKATFSSINNLAFLIAIKHLTYFSAIGNFTKREYFFFGPIQKVTYKKIFYVAFFVIAASSIILVFIIIRGGSNRIPEGYFIRDISWITIPDFFFSLWVIIKLFNALRFVLRERGIPAMTTILSVAIVPTLTYQIIYLLELPDYVLTYLQPIALIYQVLLAVIFLALGVTYVLKVGEDRGVFHNKVDRFLHAFFVTFRQSNGFHKVNARGIEQALVAISDFINYSLESLVDRFKVERDTDKNDSNLQSYIYDDQHGLIQTLKDFYNDAQISLLLIAVIALSAFNDLKDRRSSENDKKEIDKDIDILREKIEGDGVSCIRDELMPRYINFDKKVNCNYDDMNEIVKMLFTLFSELGLNDKEKKCTLKAVNFFPDNNELRFTFRNIETEGLKRRLIGIQTKTTLPHRHIVSRTLLQLSKKLNLPISSYSKFTHKNKINDIIKVFDYEVIDEKTLRISFKSF